MSTMTICRWERPILGRVPALDSTTIGSRGCPAALLSGIIPGLMSKAGRGWERIRPLWRADPIALRYAAIESTTWKEADGKFYYDTGIQGETLGEPVDPFVEISVTEDGCLLYGLGMILLERA